MDINITSLLKEDGSILNIDYKDNVDGLEPKTDDYVLKKPVSFQGKLKNDYGTLKLSGLITLEYEMFCYRCLESIISTMEIFVEEDILNTLDKDEVEDDDEQDQDDFFTYEDNLLNLDKILLEAIVLKMPMRKICKQDCKGLCPECGINLNYDSCTCKDDGDINPNMEILKKLL